MSRFSSYIPYYKRNLKLAIPIVFSQIGQIMVHLFDNIMVGHLGTTELAAASFAGSIFIIGMIFGMGFCLGLTPLAGAAYGAGEQKRVSALFQNSLLLNGLLSIGITLIMYSLIYWMDKMGQPEEVVQLSIPYYLLLVPSMIPVMLFSSIKQFGEGLGNTKTAMYITLSGNVLDIILNYGLIYGKLGLPEMGVQGAAFSTLITRILVALSFGYLCLKQEPFKQYVRLFHWAAVQTETLRDLFRTGFPISLQILSEVSAFSLTTIMAGWIGKTSIAAHQIALSMSSITFMMAMGVASATTVRVAHQFGAFRFHDLRKAAFASIHLVLSFMGLSGIFLLSFRQFIPYLFTSDPEVIRLASTLLIAAGIFQIFDGLQLIMVSALRGMSDVKAPLYISVISYLLVCLPLAYLFGFILRMETPGIWIGISLGLVIAGSLFYFRFLKLNRMILFEYKNQKKQARHNADIA